jgi:ABC-type antimicrobial peptide transport system permease subunit
MKGKFSLLLIFFLLFSVNIFAQEDNDQGDSTDLLNFLRGIVYSLCVLFVILGAYEIATSEGSAEKMKRGKEAIIYALIGLGLAMSVEAIVDLMKKYLPNLPE